MAIVDTSSNVSAHCAMLKQRGVTDVGRYYSSSTWKRLTRNEAEEICAAGLRLFTVFENDGDPALNEDTGIHHAQIALNQAKTVGQPTGSAIYFALEHLPHGYKKQHVEGVKAYVSGVQSVLSGQYQIGVYSDGVICDALLDAGLCDHAWLSASTSFEGTKEFYKSNRWSLAQHKVDLDWDGISIDTNEGKANFGSFVVASPRRLNDLMVARANHPGDAACIPELIAIGSSVGRCDEIRERARQAMVQIYGKPTLHNACACTLSLFLNEAGINVPLTFGAGRLAKRLEHDRNWGRVTVGGQQAGDVAVCKDNDTSISGADHIFFVVKRVDDDLMSIADNQESHSPHPRYASGKGGKTPVEYFLRAPTAGARIGSLMADRVESEVVTEDEETDDLVVRFDGAGNPM